MQATVCSRQCAGGTMQGAVVTFANAIRLISYAERLGMAISERQHYLFRQQQYASDGMQTAGYGLQYAGGSSMQDAFVSFEIATRLISYSERLGMAISGKQSCGSCHKQRQNAGRVSHVTFEGGKCCLQLRMLLCVSSN